MSIRVLGCSGAIAAGCKTSAYLLDDSVLIDAGTGVGDLTLAELARIDHILLSHSHLDHIVSIPLLADSVLRCRVAQSRPPITVHALPDTLAALRTHVFNGVIWPDFTRLPRPDAPALTLSPVAVGQTLVLGGRHIEVLSAQHTVPAVGYAVQGASGWWVYTGDTGPNPLLWARLAQMDVRHLIIETAFSDEESALADLSGHLCPTRLAGELAQLGSTATELHITHIKPGELDAVMQGVVALGLPQRVMPLVAGQSISID
jgi:ribonuclease BN (tRNA processing enzyme)